MLFSILLLRHNSESQVPLTAEMGKAGASLQILEASMQVQSEFHKISAAEANRFHKEHSEGLAVIMQSVAAIAGQSSALLGVQNQLQRWAHQYSFPFATDQDH